MSGPAWIDLILPCLNEAEAMPWVLANMPDGARAIVVDNGSTDDSAALARAAGATVVDAPERGYGAACHAGLLAATADVVALCDCDATIDPRAAARLATHLRAADLVVARRRPVNGAAWSLAARVANRELARRVRRRTGLAIKDVGPLRVARREPLLALAVRDRRSGYPVETLVRAADAGWRVAQVDVDYRTRVGRSKVTGTWRGSWHAVVDMSRALSP
ncbi:MAG TPA: glycosyltransferase family 2 protein [Jatrophihabitantaceae bacterium]